MTQNDGPALMPAGGTPAVKPGEVIDNATLSELFGVANAGGMRRSLDRGHLVLIADWTKHGVQNRWDGDVLNYVGQGRGDQRLERQNLTLARSPMTRERIHLFSPVITVTVITVTIGEGHDR